MGIFQSLDPLGYIDSMNMYAYCTNNPTNFVDPWGLSLLREYFVNMQKFFEDLFGSKGLSSLNDKVLQNSGLPSDFANNTNNNDLVNSGKNCDKKKWYDLQQNPKDWEIIEEDIRIGHRGGKSIRRKYRNINNGDEIGYHNLEGQRMKHSHPHLKPAEQWNKGD